MKDESEWREMRRPCALFRSAPFLGRFAKKKKKKKTIQITYRDTDTESAMEPAEEQKENAVGYGYL
jgi:hypothetical protein